MVIRLMNMKTGQVFEKTYHSPYLAQSFLQKVKKGHSLKVLACEKL